MAKKIPSLYLSYLEFDPHLARRLRPLLSTLNDIPDPRWLLDEFPTLKSALRVALEKAESVLPELEKFQIEVHSLWSPTYPQQLKTVTSPPLNLFLRGSLPTEATLGIVGTRKPNHYGIEVVEHILPALKRRPLAIVSGLARGIDSLAHECALKSRLPNIAVLGCGLEKIYPSENTSLANAIVREGGALVSEWPPGTAARPFHFPRRNRIIAALSRVVWVVQASMLSGTRHTVKYALDLGREIGATPGDIFFDVSQYPNQLIQEGATPVLSANDIDALFEKTTPLFDSQRRLVHL